MQRDLKLLIERGFAREMGTGATDPTKLLRAGAVTSCDGWLRYTWRSSSPAKFGGCMAAHITASGDEKDSATSKNGSVLGITSLTQGRSSE